MRTIYRDIVGAFIFSKDGLVLLGKSRTGGVYPGVWIVPGGGIESGETKRQALRREMLEELGIDIAGSPTESLGSSTGQSKKTLKNTGETVQVAMTFYDYKVRLADDASDVRLSLDDDLIEAQWFTSDQLRTTLLGPATKNTLQRLGMI